MEEAAGDDLEAWLASNLISMEAFVAAKANDFDTFLSLRAQAIHGAVLQLTGWGETREAPSVEPAEAISDEVSDDTGSIEYVVEEPSTDLTHSVGTDGSDAST